MASTNDMIAAKLYQWHDLQSATAAWHSNDETVVFTNGCFDLLHKGHVEYLSKAADLGQKLVIGVNSDDSVRQLKGPNRPFQDEQARATLLAALLMTDAVVIFSEETPLNLIKSINPDVMVKGGDYRPEEVVGSRHVWSYDGKVICVPLTAGYATSRIAQKFYG